jgi:hypothetical protein
MADPGSQPYEAAVVDITLHGRLDGWGLIKRLRGDSRFRGMPVVVMTGLDDPDVPTRAAELGCGYLSKDSIPEIVGRLRDAIRASMRPLRVILLLPGDSVEGTLHLPLEPKRFSDAWEALIQTPSSFVTLAEPVISAADGEREAPSGPVLEGAQGPDPGSATPGGLRRGARLGRRAGGRFRSHRPAPRPQAGPERDQEHAEHDRVGSD